MKRVKSGASGTLENPQKSRNSLQIESRRMSRESVGMEKIWWFVMILFYHERRENLYK